MSQFKKPSKSVWSQAKLKAKHGGKPKGKAAGQSGKARKATGSSSPGNNSRAIAARVVNDVLGGRSLDVALLRAAEHDDRALIQSISYGVLRHWNGLNATLSGLLSRNLRAKDSDIRSLLCVGLEQLQTMRIPPHAAISQTAEAARGLGKSWAVGLVNGVLRTWQRAQADPDEADTLAKPEKPAKSEKNEATMQLEQQQAEAELPKWWLKTMQADWPQDWQATALAGQSQAGMTLRALASREGVLSRLESEEIEAATGEFCAQAIRLKRARPVGQIPGFESGEWLVQDEAAQLAAGLLNPQAGERLLDACAAPGGKTSHLLQLGPEMAELIALDVDADRLQRLSDNLQRVGQTATVQLGDGAQPSEWWDGEVFDGILLDAPCSASGVLRRHPDIKLHRKASDISALAERQLAMLTALWQTLRPGGRLLYATCSIFREENEQVVTNFLQQQADASSAGLEKQVPSEGQSWGRPCSVGRQILPGEHGMDGFYYALLNKQAG